MTDATRPAPFDAGAGAAAIRDRMTAALSADLIGPFDPAVPAERLPLPPSRWYLTGFLAPEARREVVVSGPAEQGGGVEDAGNDEELAAGADDPEEPPEEPKAKRRNLWPASIGLSVLLPADLSEVRVAVSWADYVPEPTEEAAPAKSDRRGKTARGTGRRIWRRLPRAAAPMVVTLRPGAPPSQPLTIPDSGGLEIEHQVLSARSPGLPNGAQALAVFVVNRRPPIDGPDADQAMVFQISLSVECAGKLLPRPSHRGESSDDDDDRTADLQHRGQCEWAVGHGVAADPVRNSRGDVVGARSVWFPRAVVSLVQTKEDLGGDVTLRMEALAGASTGAELRRGLEGLPAQYGVWIRDERKKLDALTKRRREIAEQLIAKAEYACGRISEGIDRLVADDDLRLAFQLANRAMAMQARQRSPRSYTNRREPTWRPFQLAFLLVNLPSVADENHDDRDVVELIFFPTGGGKTEAYMGVAAVVMILRRLRGQQRPDLGLGLAVLLRYTLRLLTLDQLGRAATLICALELLRQRDPARLGAVRFSLGLWVGSKVTPNTIGEARKQVDDYRHSDSARATGPSPLTECPWCRTPLQKSSFEVREERGSFPEVRIGCASPGSCPFALATNPEGVPVLFVDEQIYRELPSFIIATVDKVAMLPYRGETAGFFGRVKARQGRAFLGALDEERAIARGDALPDGLRPPELIIQDELHLISGPLGTMVGLYETAVEGLCLRLGADGRPIRPKILASTATVRRARHQITALFGRPRHAMFPPAGIDAADSFFGTQEVGGNGRLYLGVAAPGRSVKGVLLRVYVSLLGAAQRAYDEHDVAADAYMTLVGYFNSLRELGGMRRLVEDEVRTRAADIGRRVPEGAINPWFAGRHLAAEPLELTSRESTQKITEAKSRLAEPHVSDRRVDVALASNMISVGLDIERLGLMVVAGQPKTTSEYIQATSRIGRHRDKPGLVVVVLNVHKPRDRSHYEHFGAYHEAFYRNVEASSVTPFSGPALERGLAGTLVALTRLGADAMIPPDAAGSLAEHIDIRDRVVRLLGERAAAAGAIDAVPADAREIATRIEQRGKALFDSWDRIVAGTKEGGEPRVYSGFDDGCRKRPRLLMTRTEEEKRCPEGDEARFVAPTSMREVEAPVHLWVVRRKLGRQEKENG